MSNLVRLAILAAEATEIINDKDIVSSSLKKMAFRNKIMDMMIEGEINAKQWKILTNAIEEKKG